MEGSGWSSYKIRCLADKFRTSRGQNRVISNVNRYLNNGALVKSDPLPAVKIPVLTDRPVKRDADVKARRKRINRRLAKGKPVEKGVLRDPPKNLEYRLAAGLKFENRSATEIALIGTGHELTVTLVRTVLKNGISIFFEISKIFRQKGKVEIFETGLNTLIVFRNLICFRIS